MLHDDLLDQAEQLLQLDARRPKQASLRRTISTAYYALFHALGYQLSRQLVGTSAEKKVLRGITRRALAHSEIAKALTGFASGNVPSIYKQVIGEDVPTSTLRQVAGTFIRLQRLRHQADYDLNVAFAKVEAQAAVRDARDAVALLMATEGASRLQEEVFLLSMLLQAPLRGRQ